MLVSAVSEFVGIVTYLLCIVNGIRALCSAVLNASTPRDLQIQDQSKFMYPFDGSKHAEQAGSATMYLPPYVYT